MIEKALRNTSDKDINHYPIEVARLDDNGNTIIDGATGKYKTTGDTLTWSIKAGESLIFPEYVADYLKSIYPFLKEVKSPETVMEMKKKGEDTEDTEEMEISDTKCKYCGTEVKNVRGLALHISAKHPEKVQ